MWVQKVIPLVLWGMFFTGIWILFFPVMQPIVNGMKFKSSRYFRTQINSENPKIANWLKYIERFLQATIQTDTRFAVYTFLFSLFMIFVLVFSAFLSTGKPILHSLLGGLIAPMIPVGFLYARLRGIRVKTSHEGKEMINELLNNYRIYNKSMIEAIDQSIIGLKKYPNSRRVFLKLSLELKDYKDASELRDSLDQMVFQIQASWSILLSNLLYVSVLHGDDVQEGLADIAKELSDLEHINQKNKQNNIEGSIMLKGILPLVSFGGLYMLFDPDIFGFTLKKYIEYQFLNEIGFTFFFYSMGFLAVTILVYMVFKNEKNDY